MSDSQRAMDALNRLIRKCRSFMYKPIQIAETLRLYREGHISDLLDLESYRVRSRRERDKVTLLLFNKVCTSSARFQDDVFNEHAIPPRILNQLATLNENGKIEKYIYERVYTTFSKTQEFREILERAVQTVKDRKERFPINEVWKYFDQPALKKSVDKLFELTIYSILKIFLESVPYALVIKKGKPQFFDERNERFYETLLGIQSSEEESIIVPSISRAGVANACDKGIDMWCNFGPAIQLKHISLLNKSVAENIVEDILSQIDSNSTILICKDCPNSIRTHLLSEFDTLKGIITQEEITEMYYTLCDRSNKNGKENEKRILEELLQQYDMEFPIASKWNVIFSRYS